MDSIHISDTRNENYRPWYYINYYPYKIKAEFKMSGVINNPFTGQFCVLLTITPWADFSGGAPVQYAIDVTGDRKIKRRFTLDANNWGSWVDL